MSEASYYENPELWNHTKFQTDPAEVERFLTCVDLLPSGTTTLLDAGCGTGDFLRLLQRARPEIKAVGLERSAAAISHKRCDATVHLGSIDDLPFHDRAFDVVAALEVLEHLPVDIFENALLELARVADVGILISVPYREGRVHVQCPLCGCAFNPHYHVRTFDERVVAHLFPNFRLLKSVGVASRRNYLFGRPVRALRNAMAPGAFFPKGARCPQCSYSVPSADPSRTRNGGQLYSLLRRLLVRAWPSRRHSKWLIALYVRTTSPR
jgi:SAM-dependent methyltransferase